MDIQIKVEGISHIIAAWEAHEKWLESALTHVNPLIEDEIRQNYAMQGRPKWKQRSKAYERQILREYGALWPILKKSGDKRKLEMNSTKVPFRKVSNGIYELNIYSVWYGKFHQYGTKSLPVRKSTTISKVQRENIRLMIKKSFIHYYLDRKGLTLS